MAFEIPNELSAAFADQAEPDKVDFDILVAGLKSDGVVSGCAVTAQGTPDMTVAVAVGLVLVAGKTAVVAAGNLTIGAADATNPRFDLIAVDNAGTKSVTAGLAASNPVFPAIPANSVILAAVYVPANDTTINANQITDKRCTVPGLARVRKTANETVNNSVTLQNDDHLFWDVAANDVWFVEVFLRVISDATADIKFGWTVPAGTTMDWGELSILDSFGTGSTPPAILTAAGVLAIGSTNVNHAAYLAGWVIVGATAGTIQLQWAQNTQTVVDTKVLANSFLLAQKLS